MSRSNNEKDERPTSVEVFFVGGGVKRDSVSEGGFEAFIFTTLGLWVSAIFIVFRLVFEIKLEDPDLGIIASVAGTLAGLSISFLTLIYQLNQEERFLKISFGFLTFVFLGSTILSVLALMTYGRTYDVTPRVEVWFLSSMVFLAPLLGKHFAKKYWSTLEHFAYTLPFLIPAPLFIATSDLKLLTTAVFLLLLGVIGLPVLMGVLIYGTLRKQSEKEETAEEKFFRASFERWQTRLDEEKHFQDLQEKIRGILETKRNEKLGAYNDGEIDTDDLLVTTEELNSHPDLSNESSELIDRALNELADRKIIYSNYRSSGGYYPHTRHHYIAPEPSKLDDAKKYFRAHSVVAFRTNESSSVELKDLRLTNILAKKYQYPRSVTAKFFTAPLINFLEEEYWSPHKASDAYVNWVLYVRRDVDGMVKTVEMLEAWVSTNTEIVQSTGMKVLRDSLPSYFSLKYHMKNKKWTVPAWQVAVDRNSDLRQFLSEEVLPKNLGTDAHSSVDLFEFFEEVDSMVPGIRDGKWKT
jgi:hypothetical protein